MVHPPLINLTANQSKALARLAANWKRLGKGGQLDEWLALAPDIAMLEKLAMEIAGTDKPQGRAFNETFRVLLHRCGLETIPRKTLTDLKWLTGDPVNLAILKEITNGMTEGERSRLNSPIAARQRVQRVIKHRSKNPDDNPLLSPMADLRKQLREKTHEVDDLTEQLDSARAEIDYLKDKS